MSKNQSSISGTGEKVKLVTLNPGHFHAALVQKNNLDQVDPEVHIYAPEGTDLNLHLDRIESFNSRPENPTGWVNKVYAGSDYLQRMLNERPGNVVITAGNNRKKAEYIKQSVDAGLNVLSDKPMAIDKDGWKRLLSAFDAAEKNNVLVSDIMTERNEVTSMIQKRLAQDKNLFGELEKGSTDDPAIVKKSVHHIYKVVSGTPLRRPTWYFDVNQQGDGIVDVTTHLIDLSMWGAFPDRAFNYQSDVEIKKASRWPTNLTMDQFEKVTGTREVPDYLQDQLVDGVLPYYSNGDINFTLDGYHAYVWVVWDFEAPPGGGDTHFSVFRGTRSSLVIRQGEEQNFKSTLYVEPSKDANPQEVKKALENAVNDLKRDYPGLTFKESNEGWELDVPDKYYLGHEAHFGKVAQDYFRSLADGKLPDWEVPNMISKYYITTHALEMALENK